MRFNSKRTTAICFAWWSKPARLPSIEMNWLDFVRRSRAKLVLIMTSSMVMTCRNAQNVVRPLFHITSGSSVLSRGLNAANAYPAAPAQSMKFCCDLFCCGSKRRQPSWCPARRRISMRAQPSQPPLTPPISALKSPDAVYIKEIIHVKPHQCLYPLRYG